MLKLPPLSIYIHIPWCIKKCFYCDFHSLELKKPILELEYIHHLIKDINNDIKLIKNRKIISIFIGGGSPSLFNIKSLKILLDYIKQNLYLSSDVEINIEVNSSKLDFISIQKYKDIGINRISVGIQSYHKDKLLYLDRIHTTKDALNISVLASTLRFNSFNFDIMYGLPNQNYKDAIDDLKIAMGFLVPHISWYQLIINSKLLSSSCESNLLNNNSIYKIYTTGSSLLAKYGYEHYEICSYAKFNNKCIHNINYWRFGDYLGIGSGAHGKISFNDGRILRTVKTNYLDDYMSGKYLFKKYYVNKKNKIIEFFMNRFRLFEPILKNEFTYYTGLSLKYIKKSIDISLKQNYLIETKYYWNITKKGKMFYNELLNIFFNTI